MVIRRMLTGGPVDLTQRAEAVGPELSLEPVAMPCVIGGIAVDRLASIPTDVRVAERPQDSDDKGDEAKGIPDE
jgi:hypothetical protein